MGHRSRKIARKGTELCHKRRNPQRKGLVIGKRVKKNTILWQKRIQKLNKNPGKKLTKMRNVE